MMNRRTSGFTLVEMIVVLTITGIIAAVIGVFIVKPVEGYLDQYRRAELVDAAEMAMQRMMRDVRQALPNSIIATGTALEMISIKDAGRYRAGAGSFAQGGNPAHRLEFNRTDDQFNIQSPVVPDLGGANDRLVVYHLGQAGSNAYNGDAVITSTGVSLDGAPAPATPAGEHRVNLPAGGHQFPLESPSQRIYVVDRAVRYSCGGGTLTRSEDAGISGTYGGAATVVTGAACQFYYDPGTATRNAVVTMEITVTRDGESITLIRQAHVENSP